MRRHAAVARVVVAAIGVTLLATNLTAAATP
jgi:hypothetical protein